VARQRPSRAILITILALAVVVGVARILRFSPRERSPHTAQVVAASRGPAHSPNDETRLLEVGPRLLSNETSEPLQIYGIGLSSGMSLVFGPPLQRRLPLHVVDGSHAYARLPAARDIHLDDSEVSIDAWIELASAERVPGVAHLTLVDDAHFPDPTALAITPDGTRVCATSTPTDELVCMTLQGGAIERLPGGDGPTALARFGDGLLLAHAFAPELTAIVPGKSEAAATFPSPTEVFALAVDGTKDVAYLAEQARDTVVALDLHHGGAPLWRAEVDPNPLRLALCGKELAVGSRQTGDVEILDAESGKHLATLAPAAGTPILGGHTEPFSPRIMGPSPVRDIAYSPKHGLLFVANTGPNIGPNPQRMEVTQNGGVTVIDLAKRKVLYHLGFGAGVPQALALDDNAGLLYAADISLGLVHILDVNKLAQGAGKIARGAQIQELPIPPPADFPLARERGDFDVEGQAGVSVHSGPSALALSASRDRLYALDRFSGTLAELDVREARLGKAKVTGQTQFFDTLGNSPGTRARRLGQVLYFADLGKTGMSCDTCHVEGNSGGVLFSKGHPIRIYRSTGIRDARDTPPYFNPASTQTLEETARHVGSRNRYQKPQVTDQEARYLGRYASEITTPPNPFVGEDGTPVQELELPDGAKGHPLTGLALFEGKAACKSCHPPPVFTTDQWPSTRGRYLAVGTPEFFPLREEMQDPHPRGYPPPTLLGVWDMFPLLGSGTGGLGVRGDQVVVITRFPLRWVLEHRGDAPHGAAAGLTAEEENDLLAYLMSL
jgi:DNA-binding beta-propeller fold protein YncE